MTSSISSLVMIWKNRQRALSNIKDKAIAEWFGADKLLLQGF